MIHVRMPSWRPGEAAAARLAAGVSFLWPFVCFSHNIVPLSGRIVAYGNDFGMLYYPYKLYLLDVLADMRIPLWSPSEGAGFPFFCNPFSQTFYPFNLPLTLLYSWTGSYTPLEHQRFTVFGLGLFSLGLFLWLRTFRLALRPILFATLVMGVSFKMGEILRFPNAVHAAAWQPWMLFAITRVFQARELKTSARWGALLSFSVFCHLTSGYPYYLYYSIFLIGPYLLLLLTPPLSRRFFPGYSVQRARSASIAAAAFVLPALLLFPYFQKMRQLLSATVDRGGGDIRYATAHVFSFSDTVGSLLYPPAAQAEGWYYFGGIGLLMIGLYLLHGRTGPDPLPSEDPRPTPAWYHDRRVKLVLVGWITVITLITYGRASPLFHFLWRQMPGFSSLRVWGRMNIILVPLLALLLALAYSCLEDMRAGRGAGKPSPKWRSPQATLLAVFCAVFAAQVFFFQTGFVDEYWRRYFLHFQPHRILFLFSGFLAYVSLALFLRFDERRVHSRGLIAVVAVPLFFLTWAAFKLFAPTIVTFVFLGATLFAAFLFCAAAGRGGKDRPADPAAWRFAFMVGFLWLSVLDLGHSGMFQWQDVRILPQSRSERLGVQSVLDPQSFGTPRTSHPTTLSATAAFSTGILPNWYFERYVNFLRGHEGEKDDRDALLGIRDGRKLFFSLAFDHPTIGSFLADTRSQDWQHKVVFYDGDRLVVDIRAPREGYFSFIDNWDPDWRAQVNGKPENIDLLFGTFKSVRVPRGSSRVVFSYRPGFFAALNEAFGR